MEYTLYLKPTSSPTLFSPYQDGDEVDSVYDGDAPEYLIDGTFLDLEAMAEWVYTKHNAIDGPPLHNGRSMSVGDVVVFHTPDGPIGYAVKDFGWKQVKEPQI